MDKVHISILPPARCSNRVQPEVRIAAGNAVKAEIMVIQKSGEKKAFELILGNSKGFKKVHLDLSGIYGDAVIKIILLDLRGNVIETQEHPYEIINSQCNSTTLLDGCWISIYHWSEDEARWFNQALKKLSNEQWKEHIQDMGRAGIKGVVIQNIFHCNEYVGQHDMNTENYRGEAMYPSNRYSRRAPIAADDPLEAILTAADEEKMNVWVGIGMYAWFDFSPESLLWHKNITKEIHDRYGHHPSLYGWYVSEEIMGSLYYDYSPVEDEKYMDIVNFFREYKAFVSELTPTKPVALAPNNIRFQFYEKEWKQILENVDVLLPFAFARDLGNLNINEIDALCRACDTHFWVDMEMFAWPLDNGLVPKKCQDLIKEIHIYDQLEQIYGYQFTGIMNPPGSTLKLGRDDTKALYKEYLEYYKKVKNSSIV